jgi:hypothetical protein
MKSHNSKDLEIKKKARGFLADSSKKNQIIEAIKSTSNKSKEVTRGTRRDGGGCRARDPYIFFSSLSKMVDLSRPRDAIARSRPLRLRLASSDPLRSRGRLTSTGLPTGSHAGCGGGGEGKRAPAMAAVAVAAAT